MAILYMHNNKFGDTPNITAFIRAAQETPNGPHPGRLNGTQPRNLAAREADEQLLSAESSKTVAAGLITCAAVIYASQDPSAQTLLWVHHANAGSVTEEDVRTAYQRLGGASWQSILVVFAHPGKNDPGYTQSLSKIQGCGVSQNNIVEIPNLMVHTFGVNNFGQLGY